ncbi:C39 family peptidase [Oscillospiraceae bacterium MB08-C2-2]|nr:C39 family peptidase [Oscillospiraceae bacterium MB08-C2-2]
MKKTVLLVLSLCAALILQSACAGGETAGPASAQGAETKQAEVFTDANKIPYGDKLELEGAAGVERSGDVKDSPYYKHPDFYNMKSSDTLTILEQFKTIQQATEWTCGPTSALMVLEWYGKRGEMNEMDLVALRQKDEPGATDLQQMINIFDGLGGWKVESTYDLADPETIPQDMIANYLKEGKPILLGWDDWGGHWQVIIGYDTMGTETTADDVLILADPYDTTDHNQDGYYLLSFERLYYNWSNRFDKDFDKNVFVVASPA